MPHSTRQHCLNGVDQPHKVGAGIRDLNLGYFDISSSALRDSPDFQRKVAQLMKGNDAPSADAAGTDGIFEYPFILTKHFLQGAIEEAIIKRFNQVLLDKRLEAEHCDLISVRQPSHTRRIIGHHLGQRHGVLLRVCRFVEVQAQQRIV